ncbi:MAG: hypothetical protein KBG47_10150 [Bacteroidia bacterium]|jgi:hypothetical protein|nr:hypothetical protein [Bacteroidia bacterium]
MKKIFLVVALVAGMCVTGVAQNLEKTLQKNKWFSDADLGSTQIVLRKTESGKAPFDVKFNGKSAMNFCYVTKSAIMDPKGTVIEKGVHYCDPQYSYEIDGNILTFKYPLVKWSYQVKTLKNGDLELMVFPKE